MSVSRLSWLRMMWLSAVPPIPILPHSNYGSTLSQGMGKSSPLLSSIRTCCRYNSHLVSLKAIAQPDWGKAPLMCS